MQINIIQRVKEKLDRQYGRLSKLEDDDINYPLIRFVNYVKTNPICSSVCDSLLAKYNHIKDEVSNICKKASENSFHAGVVSPKRNGHLEKLLSRENYEEEAVQSYVILTRVMVNSCV